MGCFVDIAPHIASSNLRYLRSTAFKTLTKQKPTRKQGKPERISKTIDY
jgi:hypothetical protein